MTRIVAGAAGGRRLAVPSSARPTTDRVREALFNVLAARFDFDGLRVLDLYAGSGALGLEALSRGAASVLLIDSDRRAVEVITRNVATVGLPGARVRRGAVAAVLAAGAPEPFDVVFADPPYDVSSAELRVVVESLSRGWVTPGAVVVVERPVSQPELSWPPGWRVWPVRRYGDTCLETAEVAD
ncbi:16S rRNA (guanine(966)-N(2))-methyltransferase RsmD [Mycolicibacterium sp.]|uniref:16S rRNA (guanine(966)-N(2))-methyltransferase RsmD n=1 Tax=Mycolicibacterium sp. TaxID=2320850 RepID=UPI001D966052|nr:16S rRNA (guanine(966)-N(2))-methyltransferase RsmD [Mycolicibacterium sp.]MCB1289970.1 16S rRNA (guanine(966)-N(2))-methyltransferase RsmD [Mycobacterium sp.]MCB9408537.1 16S rRNA (guanine(966)-N(2))-methyltransferase RsmD [Mycolicibacterium sp.]